MYQSGTFKQMLHWHADAHMSVVKWFQCLQSPNHFHPCPWYSSLPTNQINSSAVNLHSGSQATLWKISHSLHPYFLGLSWRLVYSRPCISLRLNNSLVPVYNVFLANMRFSHGYLLLFNCGATCNRRGWIGAKPLSLVGLLPLQCCEFQTCLIWWLKRMWVPEKQLLSSRTGPNPLITSCWASWSNNIIAKRAIKHVICSYSKPFKYMDDHGCMIF